MPGYRSAARSRTAAGTWLQSVKRLQRAGLQVQGGFIVGFDSDSPSIFQQQVDFIQMSGIVTAMVGLLQAPYGTRLYERMQREGRLTSEMTGDNVDGSTNIIPEMGLEPLRDGYRWLLGQIYSPKLYYARVRTFLAEYRAPAVSLRLERDYVMAFFRSVYQLGIRGTERAQYWTLLVLGPVPASQVVPAGGDPGDLRVSLSPGHRTARAGVSQERVSVSPRLPVSASSPAPSSAATAASTRPPRPLISPGCKSRVARRSAGGNRPAMIWTDYLTSGTETAPNIAHVVSRHTRNTAHNICSTTHPLSAIHHSDLAFAMSQGDRRKIGARHAYSPRHRHSGIPDLGGATGAGSFRRRGDRCQEPAYLPDPCRTLDEGGSRVKPGLLCTT